MKNILGHTREFGSIFASNDLIALGAFNTLMKSGFNIPDDVLLVGFDDIPTAHIITPGLTTIRQPTYEIGTRAAQLLYKHLIHNSKEIEHIVLEPELIIRETA